MKKVFSKEEYYQQTGDKCCRWAKECDGLTEEEMRKLGYATHKSWMIEINESGEKKNMTKDELKFGDIVTQRNGERYVIASGHLFGEQDNYYNDCDEIEDYYKNDLTYDNEDYSVYDIVKVERNGETIFERGREKRYAKKGEYIEIVMAFCTEGLYKNGDVLKVSRAEEDGRVVVEFKTKKEKWIAPKEYIVLTEYEPVKELTIKEISELLGYEVKVVKEK